MADAKVALVMDGRFERAVARMDAEHAADPDKVTPRA